MQIDVVSQFGAPTGFTVAGDVLRGPGYSVDLSALADGDEVFISLPGFRSPVRREGGDITTSLTIDGPAQSFSGDGDIGTGAAGGDAVMLTITKAQDVATAALAEAREAASLPIADMVLAAVGAGIITEAEGLAWLSTRTLPAGIQTALAGSTVEARIRAAGATEVHRNSPIVATVATVYGLDDAALDALFGVTT